MRIPTMVLIINLAFSFMQLNAQSNVTRIVSNQSHVWFILNGTIKLNEQYSLFYDFQNRRAELGEDNQQLLLRAGMLRNLGQDRQIGLGYCFVQTYPYGDFPVANSFPEQRMWEQFVSTQKFTKSTLVHRYRLEQRWIGNSATGELNPTRFENRIRYMLRWNKPLAMIKEKQLYLNLFDELFMNFGQNVGRNIYDQNRLGANIGFQATKFFKVELGYLNQIIQQRGLTANGLSKMENNHTATASVTITL